MSLLRQLMRMPLREPRLAAVAVLTVGLGIGLAGTIFSFLRGTVFAQPPVRGVERLALVERVSFENDNQVSVRYHDFEDWRARQTSFELLSAFQQRSVTLSGDGRDAERQPAGLIEAGTLERLGVPPALGRGFLPEEGRVGGPEALLIGHGVWQSRFGGDPDVLSRELRVDGVPHRVVGVMPPGFGFPVQESVWLPLRIESGAYPRGEAPRGYVWGWLRPGGSTAAAQADLTALDAAIAAEHPESDERKRVSVLPWSVAFVGSDAYVFSWSMLGAALAVLLISCVNVANLLLARAAGRARDVAVRAAIGAGRGRLVAEQLLEPLGLCLLGGGLGLALTRLGVAAIDAVVPEPRPFYWIHFQVDTASVAFVSGITLLTGLVVGALPALWATRARLGLVMAEKSRGGSGRGLGRFVRGLVVGELAVSMALLGAAGVMVKSVGQLRARDWGFGPDRLLTAELALEGTTWAGPERSGEFWEELARRLERVPGLEAAGFGSSVPVRFTPESGFALADGDYGEDRAYPSTRLVGASPGYFAALAVSPVDGRLFDARDSAAGQPVAIVNQSFVREHLSGRSPLGQRLRLGRARPESPWLQVVGVVPDLFLGGPRDVRPDGVYRPLAQDPRSALTVLLRAAPGADPGGLSGPLRAAVAQVDPDVPVYAVLPMRGVIAERSFLYYFLPSLFIVFGLLAAALAALGLFGVISYSVTTRQREIGIRMALGATGGRVRSWVLGGAARQAAVGIGIGALLGAALNRGLVRFLVRVEPHDPQVLLAVVATLAAVALAAASLPAWRATRVDPSRALRAE